MPENDAIHSFPLVRPLGLSGILVTFAQNISDEANRAAIAFRDAIEGQGLVGVRETSVSLVSTYISYDPSVLPLETLKHQIEQLINAQNWLQSALPNGRRRWRVPAAFGGASGPQLAQAADLAGVSQDQAIAQITSQPMRVLTIGFAPGLPYLGTLPDHWDLPRQSDLSAQVPAGALVVAVRQLVLFTNQSPTGWRHIAQTAFQNFRPAAQNPFSLQIGDEVQFLPISDDELQQIKNGDHAETGGADWQAIS